MFILTLTHANCLAASFKDVFDLGAPSIETRPIIIISHTHTQNHTSQHTHAYMTALKHAHAHAYTVQPPAPPEYTHILHFTFHISVVMLLCHKAPHPSRSFEATNEWSRNRLKPPWVALSDQHAPTWGPLRLKP